MKSRKRCFKSTQGSANSLSASWRPLKATCMLSRNRSFKHSHVSWDSLNISKLTWKSSKKRRLKWSTGTANSFSASCPAQNVTWVMSKKLCFKCFVCHSAMLVSFACLVCLPSWPALPAYIACLARLRCWPACRAPLCLHAMPELHLSIYIYIYLSL